MILDERLEFADNVTAAIEASTANIGDVIDLGVARDIGNGKPVYLVLIVGTAFDGGDGPTEPPHSSLSRTPWTPRRPMVRRRFISKRMCLLRRRSLRPTPSWCTPSHLATLARASGTSAMWAYSMSKRSKAKMTARSMLSSRSIRTAGTPTRTPVTSS